MDDDYNDSQDSMGDNANECEPSSNSVNSDNNKDFSDGGGFDDSFEDEEGGAFRGGRGRGNFRRGRGGGPPPSWGPPMRFRGRGYGPGGPPGRGGRPFTHFRGRGGQRFNGPGFDNWGPMGPPPAMMNGPPPFGPPPMMGGPMGPPPNMMGQPPFGIPPNMAPELWVETKSPDGKSYFYHARTRETTWTRPQESPTLKVITQQEMEAMSASGQMSSMTGPTPMGGMGMGGMMSGGAGGMLPPSGPPFMQPPPWMKHDGSMGPGPMGPGGPNPMVPGPNPIGPGPTPMGAGPSPMGPGPMGPGPTQMGPGPNQIGQGPSPMGPGPNQMGPGQMGTGPSTGGPMNPDPMDSPSPRDDEGPPGEMPLHMNPQHDNGPPGSGTWGWPPPMLSQPPPHLNSQQQAPPVSSAPSMVPNLSTMQNILNPSLNTTSSNSTPTNTPSNNTSNGIQGSLGQLPGSLGQLPGSLGQMPGQMTQMPGQMTQMPGQMTQMPSQMNQMPGQMTQMPGQMNQMPGQMNQMPGQMTQMPGQMTQLPGQINQMPSQMNQMPNQISQMQSQMNQMEQLSRQMQGQTAQMIKQLSQNSVGIDSPQKKQELVIPPGLEAAAGEWSTHRAPDGRPYYYHAGRNESVWKKPQPLQELEDLQAKIAKAEKGDQPEVIEIDDNSVEDYELQVEAQREKAERERKEKDKLAQEKAKEESEKQEKEKLEKEKAEKEKAEKDKDTKKSKQDMTTPISMTPIYGTHWCVVWTKDGSVLFYNPMEHLSKWKRPAELVGRPDVDRAVNHPPQAVLDLQQKAAETAAKEKSNGELKRTGESESDESESESKRQKVEEKEKEKDKETNKGRSSSGGTALAAMQAELAAAKERAQVPLERRVATFREMMLQNGVSAFSTWEKELHKIVYDPRYLLLTSKERKQVFEKYVRERAEEERREKKMKLQQKRTEFRQLMEEAKLHSKSSFLDFSSKHGKDDRFKGIEKQRDRESYFNEFIIEVRKREKEEKERKRELAKTEFIEMLKEKSVDRHARWADVKKKVDADPRYKAVDSSSLKEDYFREYCKIVKDERKKEKDAKEKDRERKKEKKDKDKDREKDKKEKKEKKDKADSDAEHGSDAAEEVTETSEDKDREARAAASIKEREKEVQRALANSLRDRDKEREYHKRDEAQQHFNALLADLVRNADLTWREAKKVLKKDHRYSLAELLSKEDKERLFTAHTNVLSNKRRDKFRSLLDELGVTPTHHWREVRKTLKGDGRAPTYASQEKMEREFREYQRDMITNAKTEFRQLLLESRSLTHKSLAAVKASKDGINSVLDLLRHDARFSALDCVEEERTALVEEHLEELQRRGPPPPPTATDPPRPRK